MAVPSGDLVCGIAVGVESSAVIESVCCASCHSRSLEGGAETYFQPMASAGWVLCVLCARCKHTLEDSAAGALQILQSLAIEFHSAPDGAVYTVSRAS